MVIKREKYEEIIRENERLNLMGNEQDNKIFSLTADKHALSEENAVLREQIASLKASLHEAEGKIKAMNEKAAQEDEELKKFQENAKRMYDSISDFAPGVAFDPSCGMNKKDKENSL